MPSEREKLLRDRGEWRTLLVAGLVYGGTVGTVWGHDRLGFWITTALLAWFGAWHLSLQHELLHGHPFRAQRLNDLLASVPLTLWIPYGLYKPDHLEHHRSDLTIPGMDNESYYVSSERWASMVSVSRAYHWANRTFLFRIFVNTIWSTFQYHATKLRLAAQGHRPTRRAYAAHLFTLIPVLWLVVSVASMPLWQYALGVTYGGRVLNSIRSFPEHRYQPGVGLRTAMIEAGPVMSLLMLNNNLHVLHHDEPWHPWYTYRYVAVRLDAYERAAAAGLRYRGGYWEVLRRYAVRPIDPPVQSSS